jgi:broad specificity phosphatase PhoE
MINKMVNMTRNNSDRTVIIIVRHGECKGNREGLFRGRSDFPLNETGINQVKELAKAIRTMQPTIIFTSPLLRAVQTAKAIQQECNIRVENKEGFNNIMLGPWEGQPKDYIAEKYPEQWETWLNKPEELDVLGMESLDAVQKRAKVELDNIIQNHWGETFVLVSHRAVLKPLIASCLGIKKPYFWRIHVDTASYSILHYHKVQGYILVQLNQNKHLTELITEWE